MRVSKRELDAINRRLVGIVRKLPQGSIPAFGFVLAVGAVGVYMLVGSHAGTPTASFEAEAGAITGMASGVSDSTASVGSSVKFGVSGGRTCPAYPQFPDASCTGVPVGVSLSIYTGPMIVTTANTLIDGKKINGCIEIDAPGVVIKNSQIVANAICNDVVSSYDGYYSGTPLLIQDSEVDCRLFGGSALGDANINALRLNIHGCENGGDFNENITFQDSFIHDMYNSAEAHTDGIQLSGHLIGPNQFAQGSLNVSIVHNTIFGMGADGTFGTSAIISNPNGLDKDILVQNNLLAGGAYTLYCDYNGTATNYRVIGNHFSVRFGSNVGAYAPWTDCADEAVVTGNVYDDGTNAGKSIPF